MAALNVRHLGEQDNMFRHSVTFTTLNKILLVQMHIKNFLLLCLMYKCLENYEQT